MMTGMVRSGCYGGKKKRTCDQGLPDIFFELTSLNADLPQICASQTHRQAPEFSFSFNEELEEKYLQYSTGLNCTYLKIACQGVQVAHGQNDFIWKLSHRAAFIISWKSGHPPGAAANLDKNQMLRSTTRWHCDAAMNCRALKTRGGFNLLNT